MEDMNYTISTFLPSEEEEEEDPLNVNMSALVSVHKFLTTETSASDYIAPVVNVNPTLIHYKFVVPVLVILCTVSTAINMKILASLFWIRRPLSPTLQISLSLAGADAYSSSTCGIGLFVNSWLSAMNYLHFTTRCPTLVFEALRLGGIIMTVMHLLYLAGNHYLGIVRPLHYASIMTKRHTNFVLAFVWLLPIAFFFVYFSTIDNDGFRVDKCNFNFMKKWHFRMIFSSLFFAPFVLMVFIYGHIFIIVRRHQSTRLRFQRTGSMGAQRRIVGGDSYRTRGGQEQQLERNVKALWTTLMILGSYVVGWMPGTIYFLMVCDDCYLPLNYFHPTTTFYICLVTNLFIIMKTMMNPIIYAARMNEIKIATSKMNSALKDRFKRKPTVNRNVQPLVLSTPFNTSRNRVNEKVNLTLEEWNSQSHTQILISGNDTQGTAL